MNAAFCVIVTTTDSEDNMRALVAAAIEAKLAACAQVFPVRSFYTWKGERCEAQELRIEFKAKAADAEALMTAIRAAHAYETPEILRLDIAAGDPAYLAWIAEVTGKTGDAAIDAPKAPMLNDRQIEHDGVGLIIDNSEAEGEPFDLSISDEDWEAFQRESAAAEPAAPAAPPGVKRRRRE